MGHVWYINIPTWPRGVRVKIVRALCLTIPKRDFSAKKTTPNITVCPESLEAMWEYWYIERDLTERKFCLSVAQTVDEPVSM